MKSYEALETTLMTILAIAGGISVITGAAISIKNLFFGPFKRLRYLEQTVSKNVKRMTEVEETIKIFLISQKAILDHLISGDSEEELKEASKNIDNHLIERIGH
ncbi:MAG: hypothetical protein GX222_07860 [Ruminococcaceae bacterium]|nr:hypothetical protein [Oscillospiraceae bacterium]